MSRIKSTSPALVISILALVAAIVVPAFALTKKETRVVKKIANKQITKRAPGLAVASAKRAGDADKVDGQDASAFTPAGEVHSPARLVLDDPTVGDAMPETRDILVAGPFTIRAVCFIDAGGDVASLQIRGPNGSSFSGTRLDGTTPTGQNHTSSNVAAVAEVHWQRGNKHCRQRPLRRGRTQRAGCHSEWLSRGRRPSRGLRLRRHRDRAVGSDRKWSEAPAHGRVGALSPLLPRCHS